MNLISRDELKAKLDRQEDIKLVFAMGESRFRALHIPGSLNVYRREDAEQLLDRQDEIVVYCAHELCNASINAYYSLVSRGYSNVRRYAGGLSDWASAGYPLEGDMVAANSQASLEEARYQETW